MIGANRLSSALGFLAPAKVGRDGTRSGWLSDDGSRLSEWLSCKPTQGGGGGPSSNGEDLKVRLSASGRCPSDTGYELLCGLTDYPPGLAVAHL